MPKGGGRVVVLLKKELNHPFTHLPIGNERIQCFGKKGITNKWLLEYIYYMSYRRLISGIYWYIIWTHTIIIRVDFDENLLVTSSNKRSKEIYEFMNESKLKTDNINGRTVNPSNPIFLNSKKTTYDLTKL